MPFTEHLFDRDGIRELTKERAANLKANRGLSDFLGFALHVIAQRLEKDPLRYRDYGPYWPALKRVLANHGRDYGLQDWPVMAATYSGDSDLETVVMADEFRTWYMAHQIIGTNQFMLDGESGETWTLEDDDMEGRV